MRDQVSAVGLLQQVGFCDFSPKPLTVVEWKIKDFAVFDNGLKVLVVGPKVGVWWHRSPRRLHAPATGLKGAFPADQERSRARSVERSVAQRFYRLRSRPNPTGARPTQRPRLASPPLRLTAYSLA